MMINIREYIDKLVIMLKNQFKSRLLYVGLQGSYMRGEANPDSDIDIMVIIDEFCIDDMNLYRSIIRTIGDFDKSCGFICGKNDIGNWNPFEICHLLHTTKDCYGVLHNLVPEYTRRDIINYVKISINNLYHEICHRYIHSDSNKNIDDITTSYKSVFFILQNIYYLEQGDFVTSKSELLSLLSDENYDVLKRSMLLKEKSISDFDDNFSALFLWCQKTMRLLG